MQVVGFVLGLFTLSIIGYLYYRSFKNRKNKSTSKYFTSRPFLGTNKGREFQTKPRIYTEITSLHTNCPKCHSEETVNVNEKKAILKCNKCGEVFKSFLGANYP